MKEVFNKVKNSIFGPKNKVNDIPESARQEMLQSLKLMDDFDLYSINVSELGEHDVSAEGDIMKFKNGVVQKDEIGNYIIINGMKCREYQSGISGFVYKYIKDRYHFGEWLEIGFCDKGKFKKSITIEDSGRPKECELFPREVSRLLGGPLYEIKENFNSFYQKKSKRGELTTLEKMFTNIKRSDVYGLKSEFDRDYNGSHISYKDGAVGEDEEGKYLSLDGTTFYEFKPGMSGLVYLEFLSKGLHEPSIFLAEYEDGKMVGEGMILSAKGKHIVRK